MADALVTVVTEAILKKVASIAANEIGIVWGYKEKLHTLEGTLKMIRAKLQDAENEKGQKHGVMEWLKQLKDVVGEADDVMDEVHYEMLRREVKNRDHVRIKVPSLPSLKKLSIRRELGHKIKNINEKLSQINKQANDLGLQNEQPCPVVPYRPYPETVPNLDEFKIVGREDEEERIIHLLTKSRKEEKLTIVPITGMGGMGKTTLAKSVYNNPKTQQYFDVKAWLCVSVKVDINTLLAKIYESVAGEKPKSVEMANLIISLEEKLGSKRYLLVLDDVWDEERSHWEEFKRHMMMIKSQVGSGVIVTTRKLDIGTKAMTTDSCPLKGLSDDHCWNIFKERAFLAGQSPPPELEKIGHDIVKKCCGLPLLVKVIGGVLQNYSDPEKWLTIRNSKVWDLEDETERVQKSLELSLDNLPRRSIAKQCFASCSIFKKDKVMKRKKLVQLWMALGLIQVDEERNKEMEDVGNDIFQILVSNSLFQDVRRDEYGHITHCSMHDLVHDLS
ncbi:putative disease resistance protein RGA3 [Lactuca sativa]|uniref:putative disease resistance protein RGA3 n=1 Tax=Lactuca sativa TaxID=4236 RepID=UPI000CC8CF7B|nr:putative disease resistance protein RGA3 [Lactuca sativa]